MLAHDPYPVGGDLPRSPHLRIDHGLHASAIGRALRDGHKLLGLHRQERQCDYTYAIDFQPQ